MVTQPFQMKTWFEDGTTFIEISGSIDEQARFTDVKLNGKVVINLEGVKFLNSVGTRSWCLWVQRFRPPIEVSLIRCPVIMVKSFPLVKNFLTSCCTVESFFVPYYSESTGERKDFLAIRGTHFEHSNVQLPELKDSKGNEMELDIIPEIYLSFLKSP